MTVPWLGMEEDAPDGYHNVNDNFRVCARIGFFTYIFITGMIVIGQNLKALETIFTTCGCPIVLLWLTNLLVVMIYRWRHAGKVCSGDYLTAEERPTEWLES